jgi:Cutinase
MVESAASAPAGPSPGRHYRKKLLKAGPVGMVMMIGGVVAAIIIANLAGGPAEAPPATGILAAAEAPDAGAYGGNDCAPVMFIGARGSGEAPTSNWYSLSAYDDKYRGLGPEIWSLYQQLQQRSRGYLPFLPVMYPAANVFPDLVDGNLQLYTASVASGASAVVSDIQLLDHACDGTPHHYVLAGYSQGAWVIHDALQALAAEGPAKLAEISGVALFGDPDFLPFKPWVRDFKWVDLAFGSAAVAGQGYTDIPAQVAPRTASYCFPNDPVCQASTFNIEHFLPECLIPYNPLCPHFDYVHFGEVTEAAEFLAPLLPR